jgi:DNA-binding MarR family transcriptional regulator
MKEITENDDRLQARLLINRARDMLLNARQKELAPYNISSRQAYILHILNILGHKATLVELAEYNEREINTLSVQMTKMEKDGLVKKVRETPKSTLLRFELTEKGQGIYNQSKKMKSDKAIMSALSDDECSELIVSLTKIIKKAAKYQ